MKTLSRWTPAFVVGAMLVAGSSSAFAQQKGKTLKEQVVGTWTFVSAVDVNADGSRTDRWGPDAKGIFMFDANGRFAQFIVRSDLPKFASKKATEGTAEENKAILKGAVGSFGTYTVNEAEKTVVTTVEGSVFPNLVGVAQQRKIVTLNATELKYVNPATSTGTIAEAVWKRAK
jgi:lipocalin-like protein